MNNKFKLALGIAVLLATLIAFVRYIGAHPDIITNLSSVRPATLLALLATYILGFIALIMILQCSLRMYGKTIPRREGALLSAYSALVNFFGPGQSGAAVRGLYLKKRYDFKLKSYMFTTLLYYGFYAVLSTLLLLVGSQPWWQTTILLSGVALCSLAVIKWYMRKSSVAGAQGVNAKNLALLFGATALQILALTATYYVELTSVDPSISVVQALGYTGAANFALFVALTPGAIGIREAFLVFSQSIHHISSETIVAANVIDRAVYLVLLGILFAVVVLFHANNRFRLTKNSQQQPGKV